MLASRVIAAVAAATLAVGLTACSSDADAAKSSTDAPVAENPSAPAGTQCYELQFSDTWAKATKAGATMTGVFGTLKNRGSQDITIKGGTSDRAKVVELHETVAKDGGMKMQAKDGGFTIKPGQSITLEPGKDHIMLMKLTSDLLPGENAMVMLTCGDDSKAPLQAEVREFSGANEDYAGGHGSQPTGTLPAGVDLPGQSPS